MDLIKELLLKEKDYIVEEIRKLTDRLNDVNHHLGGGKHITHAVPELGNANNSSDDITSDSDFPRDGGYLQQILYIIKAKNRFLHNAEITSELSKYYFEKDVNWLKRRVSAVLSHGLKEIDTLTNLKFSPSKQDTVWGNKNWLNEDGTIKQEFMYTEKKRTEQKKIEF